MLASFKRATTKWDTDLNQSHQVFIPVLHAKCSGMTCGHTTARCSPFPSFSRWAARAWLTTTSPCRAESSRETPQLNPCWNIRASVPLAPAACLSNGARPSPSSSSIFQRQSQRLGNTLSAHRGPIWQSNTWEGAFTYAQVRTRRETPGLQH